MPDQTTLAPPATARLEPSAISVAQDTLIGLADTCPTVSVRSCWSRSSSRALTRIIANAYRRLKLVDR